MEFNKLKTYATCPSGNAAAPLDLFEVEIKLLIHVLIINLSNFHTHCIIDGGWVGGTSSLFEEYEECGRVVRMTRCEYEMN